MVLKTGEFSPNIKTCGYIQKVTTGLPSNVNKKPDKSQNIPEKHARVEVPTPKKSEVFHKSSIKDNLLIIKSYNKI